MGNFHEVFQSFEVFGIEHFKSLTEPCRFSGWEHNLAENLQAQAASYRA